MAIDQRDAHVDTVLIENWMRVGSVLYGNVYDHAAHQDGAYVRTSAITMPAETNALVLVKGDIVKTKNTTYLLGSPLGRLDS